MKAWYDLHIHSALSPCADRDMTPGNIVGMAKIKELDVIAVADHNAAGNLEAVSKVCKEYGIILIPAMELETREEFHNLCLFPTIEAAKEMEREVAKKLPPIRNDESVFGPQELFDEDDNVIGKTENLLSMACDIRIEDALLMVKELGGVLIPAHIDRPSYSIISNLGFIPRDFGINTAEVYNLEKLPEIKMIHRYLEDYKIISDSDAHNLGLINERVNYLEVEELSVKGILDALK